MTFTDQSLMEIANNLNTGYLKPWKALSMIVTLREIPGILKDEERTYRFVKNCLEMEGFYPADIQHITIKLLEHKDNLGESQ